MLQQIVDELSLGEVNVIDNTKWYMGVYKIDDKIETIELYGKFNKKSDKYFIFSKGRVMLDVWTNRDIIIHEINHNYISKLFSLFDNDSTNRIVIIKNNVGKFVVIKEYDETFDLRESHGIRFRGAPILK